MTESETRVQRLAARLHDVLDDALTPDAAGSTALALALLAVQAEGARKIPLDAAGKDALMDDVPLLPAFIEAERDRGSTDDLTTLVRRFVQGERAPTGPRQADPGSAIARRRARLRVLQREGVDLTLIEATLVQSPVQRIANMERQLQFVRRLQQAKRHHEAGG